MLEQKQTQINVDKLVWEDLPCPVCHSNKDQVLFTGPDRLLGYPGQFQMVRCEICQLIRQNPRPVWDSLAQYYEGDYDSYVPMLKERKPSIGRFIYGWGTRKRVKAIQSIQASGNLLDIGCGTGMFLEMAQKLGAWTVSGVEPSPHAANYVQGKLDIPIQTGLFPDVKLPVQHYDVITMWNVVEHLGDPIESFARIHDALKPGGWFVFCIPNLESLDAWLFGKYWLGWDLPRHLYIFPQVTLKELLANTGFQIQKTRCISTTYAAYMHNLEFLEQDQYSRLIYILLKMYRTRLFRLIITPLLWCIDKLLRGSIITIFAQKIP